MAKSSSSPIDEMVTESTTSFPGEELPPVVVEEEIMAAAAGTSFMYAPQFPKYLTDNVSLSEFQHNIFEWQRMHPGNGSGNYSDDDNGTLLASVCEAEKFPYAFQATVYFTYILIFVLALLGNGMVCYIVQSSPRMRTVTNYFIANLAIGDILMSLFCVPFSFLSILILNYWPFGTVLCHLVNYTQAISVLVSAYTLVAISVDRYIVIMWPLRPRITKR